MTDHAKHLDDFEAHMKRLKPGIKDSLLRRYRTLIEEFLKWHAQCVLDAPLCEVTADSVKTYLDEALDRGNARSTLTAKLTALQAYFRYLTYNEIIPSDPTAGIKNPGPDSEPAPRFTRKEVFDMLEAIDKKTEKGLREATLVVLGAMAGFRVDEIVEFNVGHVKTFEGVKSIDLKIVKDRDGVGNRTIPLWEVPSSSIILKLRDIRLQQGVTPKDPLLVSYKKDDAPRGNRRLTPDACDDIIKNLARNAGIRKTVTMTMLRSTYAHSLFFIRDFGVPLIQERLGLKGSNSVEPYSPRVEIHKKYDSLAEYWQSSNGEYDDPA